MTIGCPLSRLTSREPTSVEEKSASPATRASNAKGRLMYCTSTNPSAWRSCSPATYWGAKQIAALCPMRIVRVSGGASAMAGLDVKPSRPAVPASSARCRNVLRLTGRACWRVMGTSLLQMPVRTTPRTQASGRFFHGMNGRSTSASGEPRLVSAPYATSDNPSYVPMALV
jgi:hypothetical protein